MTTNKVIVSPNHFFVGGVYSFPKLCRVKLKRGTQNVLVSPTKEHKSCSRNHSTAHYHLHLEHNNTSTSSKSFFKMDSDSECQYVLWRSDKRKAEAEALLATPASKKAKTSNECTALKVPDRWDKMAAELRGLFAATEDSEVIYVPFEEIEVLSVSSEDIEFFSEAIDDGEVIHVGPEDTDSSEDTEASSKATEDPEASSTMDDDFRFSMEAEFAEAWRIISEWEAEAVEQARLLLPS